MAPQLIDLLSESLQLRQEIENYLAIEGKVYPLAEWVTLKEYARWFNVASANVVNHWIRNGIVPTENVVVVAELNDITDSSLLFPSDHLFSPFYLLKSFA